MKHITANRRSRGFVTIYVVFTSLTLIPVVGLAIDFSVLYNVKARLQTAVDAGAIAAGYTLERTTDMTNASQISAIDSTATDFFNANYPNHYWGSTQASYSVTPSEDSSTKVRSIQVKASEYVPLLFLRVLGLSQSTVAAEATVKVRFLTMMIVVDRSGSVNRAGNRPVIENALTQFIGASGTSPFVDGRDVIGLGSFGGTWATDLAPTPSFRSGTPSINTAITSTMDAQFGNNATNTVEGLHQAYSLLQGLNNTGALNVIVLLTDGRPSAFTATYTPAMYAPTSTCSTQTPKTGFVTAIVGSNWPPIPPTVQGGTQGSSFVYGFGLFTNVWSGFNPSTGGDTIFVANSNNCHYSTDPGQPVIGANAWKDFPAFPATDTYGNPTDSAVGGNTVPYPLASRAMNNPQNIRYASFNAADNQAYTIRKDTTIRPTLFVIGLNEPAGQEPLDPDWLAKIANDPTYKDASGNPVFQAGQTPGKYYNVTASGLGAAFQDIASQILRLSQ